MNLLNEEERRVLSNASRAGVENAFQRLRPNLLQGSWLETTNRYRENTVARLKQDVANGRVNDAHLSQYVASSVLLHCSDGWGFLGRALDALARGDRNTARHVGYYAELRAAMSLLASEGIGIFSRHHFILESSGKCKPLKSSGKAGLGTHAITWEALDHWATLASSPSTLSGIVTAGGLRLDEWLSAFSPGFDARHIALDWLSTWGLDLKRLSSDHEARNEASYRPSGITPRNQLSVLDTSSFLRALWTVCQPGIPSRFEYLDRHLVRVSLEDTFRATTGRQATSSGSEYGARISGMVGQGTPSGWSAGEWTRFFTRQVESQTPLVIREAAGTAPVSDPRHHFQVLSRAVLLLRLATGACLRLLQASGASRTDLGFWWRALSEERGLWRTNDEPLQSADLWADIDEAMSAIGDWEESTIPPDRSIAAWRSAHANAISVLGECERVALWATEP